MRDGHSFDISKIQKPSDITEEVLQKITAKEAIYLRQKFGDILNSNEIFTRLSKQFTSKEKEKLKSIEESKKKPKEK